MKRRTFMTASILLVTGLPGCLGDTEYRIVDTAVEMLPEGLSLSVDPAVVDVTIEYPAALTLSLEDTADDPVRIRSYGIWPFGVFALAPSPTPGEDTWKTTLFSSSYEASTRVEVGRGGSSLSLDGTPITRPFDAGESVSRRYELHGDDPSGLETQHVVDRFECKASRYVTGDDWNALDYRLRLNIGEKKRSPF